MTWQSILKNDGWRMVQAHMAEDRIMRPKRKEDHPLQQKKKQLYKDLEERLGEEPEDPEELHDDHPDKASYDPNSKYSQYHKQWRESSELKEIWKINDKIDFEYRHAVGFFQGQEPEDSDFKRDEAFYRKQGYEPPKNKRNMTRD